MTSGRRTVTITEARPNDAPAIAHVHLLARADAMPGLRLAHTADETRQYFARVVGAPSGAWWVVRNAGSAVAYMQVTGEDLDHLYVLPGWQGHGLGSALLNQAKALSPGRLRLWTFRRNARARSFYQARGFRPIRQTDGDNEEHEPNVLYEWRSPAE